MLAEGGSVAQTPRHELLPLLSATSSILTLKPLPEDNMATIEAIIQDKGATMDIREGHRRSLEVIPIDLTRLTVMTVCQDLMDLQDMSLRRRTMHTATRLRRLILVHRLQGEAIHRDPHPLTTLSLLEMSSARVADHRQDSIAAGPLTVAHGILLIQFPFRLLSRSHILPLPELAVIMVLVTGQAVHSTFLQFPLLRSALLSSAIALLAAPEARAPCLNVVFPRLKACRGRALVCRQAWTRPPSYAACDLKTYPLLRALQVVK